MKKLQNKRKVNLVAIGNLIGMLVSGSYILYNLYILVVYPYIKGQLTGLTMFGTLCLAVSVATFCLCTEYVVCRFKAIKYGQIK